MTTDISEFIDFDLKAKKPKKQAIEDDTMWYEKNPHGGSIKATQKPRYKTPGSAGWMH